MWYGGLLAVALLAPSAVFPGKLSADIPRTEVIVCGDAEQMVDCEDAQDEKCCNGPACLLDSKKKGAT